MTKHVRDFAKKRNYVHFRMRGIEATLSAIEESDVVTPKESAKLCAFRLQLLALNKELFSPASRKLAKTTVNGVG